MDWSTRFERAVPVRGFHSYTGQRSFQGSWWASTVADFVGFESWLERDQVMVMDQAADVVGFASQPFWLHWTDGARQRRHAPDYFARLADGPGVVVDVRADDAIEPEDADAFAVTALACEQVGWRYRRVGELDVVLAANLRWLAGYRHPRCRNHEFADALMRLFTSASPLLATAERVGDRIAVLPTLFHLLWSGALTANLTQAPLTATTLVTAARNPQ
ncbi:TnsA-like heteromeric transposase endonuclease subunit [Nocardia terpenica]|uniref:TnsA-like heteromeric transposase endonuclease subunit n=1 Tax=Nocardia terpenica TaxID=455432 RepID=A0A6G9ZGS0_9NOCA|nr:TnsA-like heteromeric transposase endonuclease subunit [Nocardia terpenica]QIS24758.1 TnsA-like heteromeric transposase endonuclease subunit [Nocardia terpenica]